MREKIMLIMSLLLAVFLVGCNESKDSKETKKPVTYQEMKTYILNEELTEEQSDLIKSTIAIQFNDKKPQYLNKQGLESYILAIEKSEECKSTLELLFSALKKVPTPAAAVVPFFKAYKNGLSDLSKGIVEGGCMNNNVRYMKSEVYHLLNK
ncbi:hypothetical protein AB4407_20385 [Vibrio sp. 10N.261.46.E11]|uniref:hypothetical protein n=1 Tax=Vibrio sp. 10N.261.46.E11 TaxID=3229662 RepID=UPI0035515914